MDIAGPFRDSFEARVEDEAGGDQIAEAPQLSLEEKLLSRFLCHKCKSTRGKSRRIATTGTGLSKIFDIQHNHFIALSCQSCGYTELFDPTVVEGTSSLSSALDAFFG